MNDIGKRIRKIREHKGLSVQEVSMQVGVPLSTYRDWEYGRSIRGQHYIAIDKALGISLRELLTGEKTQSSEIIGELESIESRIRDIINRLSFHE